VVKGDAATFSTALAWRSITPVNTCCEYPKTTAVVSRPGWVARKPDALVTVRKMMMPSTAVMAPRTILFSALRDRAAAPSDG
jgi:hypothetical protein